MVMTIRRQTQKEFLKHFKSLRVILAQKTNNGQDILEIFLQLAAGVPWVPTLPDGREAPPQIPSSEVRFRAAQELADRLWGRTVPETEIVDAERAQAALKAMTDEELESKVRSTLERGLAKLDERRLPAASTVAGSIPATLSEGKQAPTEAHVTSLLRKFA
jgi:hypothetical protein